MIWTAIGAIGGFAKRVPPVVWLVLAVLLTGLFWGNHRYSQGVGAERARWVVAQAAAKAKADDATVVAADRRAADTIQNTEAERARNEATVTGGRIGRDCERLRQAGADLSSIAACSGR